MLPDKITSIREIMALCRDPLKKSKANGKNRVTFKKPRKI
jgi:hypothetical protein